jgi:hypothetical protein
MGYQDQQIKGWRIYLPRSNEFIITAHATFIDHRVGPKAKIITSSGNTAEQLPIEVYEDIKLSNLLQDNSTVTNENMNDADNTPPNKRKNPHRQSQELGHAVRGVSHNRANSFSAKGGNV